MNTLILYASKYGTTKKCAQLLQERLGDNVQLMNVKQAELTNLQRFDRVIVGSSVYMGKISKSVSQFLEQHRDEWNRKELGLFICCAGMDKKEADILGEAYPHDVLALAKSKAWFGGELLLSKMNFMDKMITRKMAHIESDSSDLRFDAIDQFAISMMQ